MRSVYILLFSYFAAVIIEVVLKADSVVLFNYALCGRGYSCQGMLLEQLS